MTTKAGPEAILPALRYDRVKRAVDVTFSALALIALSPLFILIAAAVRMDSAGPVFYRQERLGRGFRVFSIHKFRTMVPDADRNGPLITRRGDERVSRIGRLLRRSKLDELPQLLNIFVGDMSFVGLRPEVHRYVDLFRADYATILSVRPGLTDLASIAYLDEESQLAAAAEPDKEYRNKIMPEKIRLAKFYVHNKSLRLDVRIIGWTLLRVVQWKK